MSRSDGINKSIALSRYYPEHSIWRGANFLTYNYSLMSGQFHIIEAFHVDGKMVFNCNKNIVGLIENTVFLVDLQTYERHVEDSNLYF